MNDRKIRVYYNSKCLPLTFFASSPLLYLTKAIPWVRYRWKLVSGPCCKQRVLSVDPSIWAVRFLRRSQADPELITYMKCQEHFQTIALQDVETPI